MEEPNGYSPFIFVHIQPAVPFLVLHDHVITHASVLNSSVTCLMASLFFQRRIQLAYMSPSFSLLQCRAHL